MSAKTETKENHNRKKQKQEKVTPSWKDFHHKQDEHSQENIFCIDLLQKFQFAIPSLQI